MQILLDSVIYGLQRFGGISQYWSELGTRLRTRSQVELRQRLPKTVLSQQPGAGLDLPEERDGLPLRVARYLPVDVRTDVAGVVHSSYYRIPLRPGQALVTTAYDFTYERYRGGLARHVHTTQKRLALARSNGIICISRSTRDDALKLFPELRGRRVEVIHLASDPRVFHVDDSPRATLPGHLTQRPYALFVGQRSGYKRFDLAMAAVATHPDLSLAVVGPPLSDAETQALEQTLPGRWQVCSHASNDLLRQLYVHAQVFLYPSDYEGFGLPILDAMACGCPVICANRSSFPEVAGDAAWLVADQSADAYGAAIRDCLRPEVQADLRRRGLDRAADFSWDRTTETTLDFYRDVSGRRRNAA